MAFVRRDGERNSVGLSLDGILDPHVGIRKQFHIFMAVQLSNALIKIVFLALADRIVAEKNRGVSDGVI